MNYKKGTQTRSCMKSVMRYVAQTSKTLWNGQQLVSGIGCQPETAFDEFLSTKLLHYKDDGVMFYHMVQSFPKGAAIDSRTAHEAARQLAGYFEGCEVLVCTHTDREHIHSHCIINSVNFETGKKVHMADKQIQELRVRNDQICEELGLPKFQKDEQRQSRGMSNAECYTAVKGESWKFRLIDTIDQCMRYASDKEEFIALMQSDGYGVCWTDSRKSITYTTPQGMKCRDDRLHSERYRKEVMELELRTRTEIIHGRTEAAESIPVFSAADADYTSAGANTTGLEGTADCNGPIRAPSFGPDSRFAGAFHPDGCLPHPAPDRGPVAGCGPDTDAAATGWEEERAAFLCAQVGAAANPLAQPDSRTGSVPGSWRYALGSMVQLGKALEPAPSDFPVKDSTVKPRHTDRKLWQTQRRKKIALGHKPDDQENESVWQHSL